MHRLEISPESASKERRLFCKRLERRRKSSESLSSFSFSWSQASIFWRQALHIRKWGKKQGENEHCIL